MGSPPNRLASFLDIHNVSKLVKWLCFANNARARRWGASPRPTPSPLARLRSEVWGRSRPAPSPLARLHSEVWGRSRPAPSPLGRPRSEVWGVPDPAPPTHHPTEHLAPTPSWGGPPGPALHFRTHLSLRRTSGGPPGVPGTKRKAARCARAPGGPSPVRDQSSRSTRRSSQSRRGAAGNLVGHVDRIRRAHRDASAAIDALAGIDPQLRGRLEIAFVLRGVNAVHRTGFNTMFVFCTGVYDNVCHFRGSGLNLAHQGPIGHLRYLADRSTPYITLLYGFGPNAPPCAGPTGAFAPSRGCQERNAW